MTVFSRETHRLGFSEQDSRIWKSTSETEFMLIKMLPSITLYDTLYGRINGKLNRIVYLFDAYNIKDNDRINIIEKAFLILKSNKKPREINDQLDEIIEKFEN